jgi:hypothetical protein
MGVDSGTCICDVDDNNQFRCSKSCKNFGEKCKKSSDCIPKKSKKNKQNGGNKITQKNKQTLEWIKNIRHKLVRSKVVDIYNIYNKQPLQLCYERNKLHSLVFDNIEGFDYVQLFTHPKKKLHPYKADVFVVCKKYTYIPDYLLGALKYASETINIEQLMIKDTFNKHYVNTGEKKQVLVSGSCATLTISAITIQFILDMVKEYSKNKFYKKGYKKVCKEFRDEYDKRVGGYLCGKGIVPLIPWFKNRVEKEKIQGPWNKETQKKMGCPSDFIGSHIANKGSTL